MKDEMSPFSSAPDPELGAALRDALAPHFAEAFVGRVMARLGQREQRGWDEELSSWFWRGLAAASLAVVLAGWGWTQVSAAIATTDASEASVASQLLDGSKPVAEIVIASMSPTTP
jgi:hypothetical protein